MSSLVKSLWNLSYFKGVQTSPTPANVFVKHKRKYSVPETKKIPKKIKFNTNKDSWNTIKSGKKSISGSYLRNIFGRKPNLKRRNGGLIPRKIIKTPPIRLRAKRKKYLAKIKAGYDQWSQLSYLNYMKPGNNPNVTQSQCGDNDQCQLGSQKHNFINKNNDDEDDDDEHTIVIKILPMPINPYPSLIRSRYKNRRGNKYYPPQSADKRMSFLVKDNSISESKNRRRGGGYGYNNGGGGRNYGSAGLLFALPMLLLSGLAAGVLLRNTATNSDLARNITISNIVNINGSTITNTFTPTNTATMTNTNNDNDNINNTNNNNDNTTNNAGKKKKKRRRRRRRRRQTFSQQENTKKELLRIFGLEDEKEENLFPMILRSVSGVTGYDIFAQNMILSRKLTCVESVNVQGHECVERVICEHFADDELIYQHNILMRISEIYLLLSSDNKKQLDFNQIIDIVNNAKIDQCSKYSNCIHNTIKECLDIM